MTTPEAAFYGVRYFEIPVSDLKRAIAFYERVFELRLVQQIVDDYPMALFPETSDGMGASGALAQGDVYVPGKRGPIVYFTVADLERTLARSRNQNATLLLAPTDVPGQGTVAEIEDSEGNRIAVFQPIEQGDSPPP
ncbi:MAG: VOC family protein [Pseudomonadota bacterium]